MTLASTPPLRDYLEDGLTLTHTIPFQFNDASEIVCTRIPAAGLEGHALVQGADYTVSGGAGATGNVVKTSGGTAGTTFRIRRMTQETQSSSFDPSGAFPPSDVEAALDRAMAVAQESEVSRQLLENRSLRGASGDTVPALPAPASRISAFMQWANDGKSVQMVGVSQLAALLASPLALLNGVANKGDPGANVAAIGLFSFAGSLSIPLGTDAVRTSGYSVNGVGIADYVADAAVNAAYVAANPRSSFISANGRGFRLNTDAIVSVTQFGALGNNIADDTAAFIAALATGLAVTVPPGTFKITSKITLKNGVRLIGAGITRTIIQSNIPGGSLFDTDPANVNFFYVAHMQLCGNGLTGPSGSGHCFNFIDPAVASGSATPQNGQLEYLEIKNFLGSDVVDNAGITTMRSAAIIQYDGLQNTYRYIYASDCGNAYVLRQTQNCRIENCACDNIDEAALVSYQNINLIVDTCDLIDCGHAFTAANAATATDPGYPVATMGMGCILSYQDVNLCVTGTKVKIFTGQAAIIVKLGEGIIFDKCWLRGDTTVDIVPKTVYAENTSGLRFSNTVFSPAVTPFFATRAFETIECLATQNAPAFALSVEKCNFEDVSNQNINYNIKLGGNGATRTYRVDIEKNTFGSSSTRSGTPNVINDILISNCKLVSSFIGRNTHTAPTNVTRTACISASSFTKVKTVIGPSEFEPNGGTITANYSGINETLLWGSAVYNPASMPTGTTLTTTVSVPGVTFGGAYTVTAAMNVDLLGVEISARVSAANTVTVLFANNTGSPQDIASGVIYVRAEEFQG